MGLVPITSAIKTDAKGVLTMLVMFGKGSRNIRANGRCSFVGAFESAACQRSVASWSWKTVLAKNLLDVQIAVFTKEFSQNAFINPLFPPFLGVVIAV